MADVIVAGFDRAALESLRARERRADLWVLREPAFAQFESAPVPSPETEEWRYTDLRGFDLTAFAPLAEQAEAENLDQVDPQILEAAGQVGERSGLAIQHNSSMVMVHLDPAEAAKGVRFGSLDRAPESFVRERLHRAVPAGRTRFTAMHAAFRTGGTFVHVPADTRVELPLQTLTYVDRDGLAVFPHTILVTEENAELTFIDRYVSPDVEGVFSNAVVEIYAGPNSK